MKIDLPLDFASLDVTQWDLEVWVCVLLAIQAFALVMCLWHDVRRNASPVERLLRRRHFGV